MSEERVGEYVVVARRYRPQAFDELVGQEHVARALTNAINTHRVGHAYLFTGARGVGKTSSARILAKALNCIEGPTPTPCNQCEICQGVSGGDDIDVLEIDGASNRGIDEMRNLRQNVNIRPSRARFKIYIIDEVHMLTKEAFNALLKTLEEPPEHVKFIFCTTEAEKIPITVLSRCQRFDFAGIQAKSIVGRLRQIVDAEGVQAETEALEILARRAGGSMRDSQSLLEQLLSFGGDKITAADVHAMLGSATDGRLGNLVVHLVERNAAAALADLDAAVTEGVDVGQLLDQLLGYFRDVMTASVGCAPDSFLNAAHSEHAAVQQAAQELGLDTVLAILQILDQAMQRLRYSTHRRTLVELALVRVCALADMDRIQEVIGHLRDGTPLPAAAPSAPIARTQTVAQAGNPPAMVDSRSPAAPAKKKPDNPPHTAIQGITESPPGLPPLPLTAENVEMVWKQVLDSMSDIIADSAAQADSLAIPAPNRLVVGFPARYTSLKVLCEQPDQTAKLERALAAITGQSVRIEFTLVGETATVAALAPRPVTQRARMMEKSQHPLVRRAEELFGARLVSVEE